MKSLRLTLAIGAIALLLPATALAAPGNSTPPSVSGDGSQAGSTLSVDPGSWSSSPTFAYQWQRCNDNAACADIAGATSASYTASGADAAGYLQAVVTATDGTGSASATAVEGRGSGPPRPTDDPDWGDNGGDIGEALVSAGGWIGQRPITVSYEWGHCTFTNCGLVPIPGATGRTYVTTPSDWGTSMAVYVEAHNASGNWARTTVVGRLWGTPHILFTPDPWGIAAQDHYYAGEPLPLRPPIWKPSTVALSYQWQRCDPVTGDCPDIPGATSIDYVPTAADIESSLQLTITASNDLGTDVEQAWSGIIEANPNPPPPSPPPPVSAGSSDAPPAPAAVPVGASPAAPISVAAPKPQVKPVAKKPKAAPKKKAPKKKEKKRARPGGSA
jgi:large repetitive protein